MTQDLTSMLPKQLFTLGIRYGSGLTISYEMNSNDWATFSIGKHKCAIPPHEVTAESLLEALVFFEASIGVEQGRIKTPHNKS